MDKIKSVIKFLIKIIFIYSFCGGFYLFLETAYRQYTFVEMYYLAGFLGLIAMLFNNIFSYETDYIVQVICVTTTAVFGEGLVGNLFNMDYHIWDYRDLSLSFWNSQINLYFIFIWIIIITCIIPILDYIDWRLFNYKVDTPPYYKIFGRKIFQFKK